MSDFQKLLDRFAAYEQDLSKMGTILVDKYPQSKNLLFLTNELAMAVQGLEALKNRLETSLTEAELEHKLKQNLTSQMDDTPQYKTLSDRDKDKLTEYLVQNKLPLAKEEELIDFIKKSMEQKTPVELLSEFPKSYLMELGQDAGADDDFRQYQAGVNALLKELENPETKSTLLSDLAKNLWEISPETTIKVYYNRAFQHKKEDVEVPAPIPAEPGAQAQPVAPEPLEVTTSETLRIGDNPAPLPEEIPALMGQNVEIENIQTRTITPYTLGKEKKFTDAAQEKEVEEVDESPAPAEDETNALTALNLNSPLEFPTKFQGEIATLFEEHDVGDPLKFAFITERILLLGEDKALCVNYEMKDPKIHELYNFSVEETQEQEDAEEETEEEPEETPEEESEETQEQDEQETEGE